MGEPDDTTSWAPSATGPSAPRLVMLAGPDLGGVSRVHCSLRRDATGVWLRDLGSTNGTRPNGESLPPQEDVLLEAGVLVAVGGAIFKLLDGASPESQYHERVFETMALDGLTPVRNRRALEDALEAEFARTGGTATRSRCCCSTSTTSRA